jgi:hypothetical protein
VEVTVSYRSLGFATFLAVLFLFAGAAHAQRSDSVAVAEAAERYVLPPAVVQDFFLRDPSHAVLDLRGTGPRACFSGRRRAR